MLLMTEYSLKPLWHERIVASNHEKYDPMIEPLLCGIVLGLVPITLLGLLLMIIFLFSDIYPATNFFKCVGFFARI